MVSLHNIIVAKTMIVYFFYAVSIKRKDYVSVSFLP